MIAWVINNHVDLDPTIGTQEYTGASGSGAKTHNGHSGIDIDVLNFRWMDAGVSIVLIGRVRQSAAMSGSRATCRRAAA